MTIKIDARLTYEKVSYAQDIDAHIVVSITAPAVEEAEKRPPLAIVACLDVSPSMESQRKFEYAKKSLYKLIDNLQAGDYFALISFCAKAKIEQQPIKVTTELKEILKSKVGELRIGSATNIADALLTGLEVANKMDLPAEYITRVILLTDGEANTGIAVKAPDILRLVEPNLGLATVSAFGYGKEPDQDLLSNIAKLGKANYAYIADPDAALSAFGKELGGLLSTYATDLVLEFNPLAGHSVTGVVSDVEADESDIGGEVLVRIPNVMSEETRHIVLGVKLSTQKTAFPRAVNIFDVKLAYDILDPTARKERKEAEAKVKVQFVKPGEEQDKPNKELDKIVGLAQVVRAQIEAEELAKKGDYGAAVNHMQHLAAAVKTRGLVAAASLASNVGDRLGSAVNYAAGSSYLKSVAGGITRGYGVTAYDKDAALELSEMGLSLSNSMQASTSMVFDDSKNDPHDGAALGDFVQDLDPNQFTIGAAGDAPAGGLGSGLLGGAISVGSVSNRTHTLGLVEQQGTSAGPLNPPLSWVGGGFSGAGGSAGPVVAAPPGVLVSRPVSSPKSSKPAEKPEKKGKTATKSKVRQSKSTRW